MFLIARRSLGLTKSSLRWCQALKGAPPTEDNFDTSLEADSPGEEDLQKSAPEDPASPEDLAELSKREGVIADYKITIAEKVASLKQLKKRHISDKHIAETYGITKPCKAVLGVVDNLIRAIEASPEGLKEELEALEGELMNVLNSRGVSSYGELKDTFEPDIHEALYQIPGPEGFSSQEICFIESKGYMIHDRVLRAAKVGFIS